MESGTINSFLDRFLGLADAGFGLIQGDVAFVLNALIVISVVLSGAMWALNGEAPIAPLFRKVLFVGFFAFLVNNWQVVATAINQSGAMLGLQAGGGGLTIADLHNPARLAGVGKELFGRTLELGEGMNTFTDFLTLATLFVAAIVILVAFFVLAIQIFVSLITFKLGSLAAFVALPWGVFSGTAWVAERPLGWVATSAIRLFVLAFVASGAVTFIDALPATLTLENGGALDVMLFGLTLFALSFLAPTLASEVMQGSPSLSAAQPVQTGMAAVGAGMGLAVSTRLMMQRAGGSRGGGKARGARASGGAGGGSGGSGGGRRGASQSGAPSGANYSAMQPKRRS